MPLGALSTNVDKSLKIIFKIALLPKGHFLDLKHMFSNSFRSFATQQNIAIGRVVIGHSNPVDMLEKIYTRFALKSNLSTVFINILFGIDSFDHRSFLWPYPPINRVLSALPL